MTDRLLLLRILLATAWFTSIVTGSSRLCTSSDESSRLPCPREQLVRRASGNLDTPSPHHQLYRVYDANEIPSYSSSMQSHINYEDKKNPLATTRRPGSKKASLPKLQASKPTNSRQHKAFFVNYPALQRVYNQNEKTKPKRKKQQKKKQTAESEIYYIRLPPSPYSFVPGLGYVSQPPSYSLLGTKKKQPPKVDPFIKVPIDFVSNGKPTNVYRTTKDSPLVRLNRGPYVFDGRPTGSIYLLDKKTNKKTKLKTRPKVNDLYR